jgi:electron transport complex protein RnfE
LLFETIPPSLSASYGAAKEENSMQEEKTRITWNHTFFAEVVDRNWVLVLTIGLCPALAVSTSVVNCISMGAAATFCLVCSSVLISILRKQIPNDVRITAFIVIIGTFVTIVDYSIQAISLNIYNALGAFISLIVVNCILLAHAEAYASKNSVMATAVNAFGTGVGFTFALLLLGVPREILGSGTIFGYNIVWEGFQTWLVMQTPVGGFFTMPLWIVLINWLRRNKSSANCGEGGCHG